MTWLDGARALFYFENHQWFLHLSIRPGSTQDPRELPLSVRTHWTDKICLALPKLSTKFVSAKFSICQTWAHWDALKYLLTTSFNHTEINTNACSLFAVKVALKGVMGLRCSLTASIKYVASAYYCLCSSCLCSSRLNPTEAVATFSMPVEASTASFWF